jgi:hypothetical protein
MTLAGSPSHTELIAAMAHLREPTGTDTPVTAAHVGPVTPKALAGYPDSGAERVVLELPTLDGGDTLAQLGEFVGVVKQLGW